MRAYRLKLREQRSPAGESGKLPPAAKRANHKAYMVADQQAGEESISPEEIPFLHLKPLLQNIVYPEAINEIKALTAAAAGGDVEFEGLA